MNTRIVVSIIVFLSLLSPSWVAYSQSDDLVTMDFQSVELDQLVRFIAEMSGRNFVLNEKVKGNVTVVTPSPITKDDAFRMFEAVLEVHGFTIEPGEKVDKIVPINLAPTLGIPVQSNTTATQAGSRGDSVEARLVSLQYVEASSLASTLKPLVSSWGNISASVPTNALIITDSSRNMSKLLAMIASLDVEDEDIIQKTYELRYADPAQAEKTINSVYTDFNKRRPKGLAGVSAFSDSRANLLIVTTPLHMVDSLDDLIARIDKNNSVSQENFHIYYPENTQSEDIAKVLNEFVGKFKPNAPSSPKGFEKQVTIVPDEGSNSLLISASPSDFDLLLPLIKGLDIPRRQVFVEAIIVEVTDEQGLDVGVDFVSPTDRITDGEGNFGGSTFGLIQNSINPITNTPVLPNGFSLGVLENFFNPFTGENLLAFGALVQLFESNSNANVLSTPNLLVVENEEAEFSVGQNVPFITGNQSNNGGNVIQTIERKDVGLVLKIKPQILDDGKIKIDVYNEVSSIASTVLSSSTDLGFITNKRSIDTHAVLENGQTIVLGGLISEDINETVKKVPFFGSIPLLGVLFRSTSETAVRRNLMIFIQPHIIDSYSEIAKISERKYLNSLRGWEVNRQKLKRASKLPDSPESITQ